MPNEWNNALEGLIRGGTAIGNRYADIYEQNTTNKAYTEAMDLLTNLLQRYKNPTESSDTPPVENPESKTEGMPSEITPENIDQFSKITTTPAEINKGYDKVTKGSTIKREPLSLQDLYKNYFKLENNLTSRYGAYGKQAADNLGRYFSAVMNDRNLKLIQADGNIFVYNEEDPSGSLKLLWQPESEPLQRQGEETYDAIEGKFYKSYPIWENGQIVDYQRVPISEDEYNMHYKLGRYAPRTGTSSRGRLGSPPKPPAYSSKESMLIADLTDIYKQKIGDESLGEEKSALAESDRIRLAQQYGVSEDEIDRIANMVVSAHGDEEKKDLVRDFMVGNEMKMESANDKFNELFTWQDIQNLWMADTSTEEGMKYFDDQSNWFWEQAGANWEDTQPEVMENVYGLIWSKLNEIRSSKGLPPLAPLK